MQNPILNDEAVLEEALAALSKAKELHAEGRKEEAADLYQAARAAVREQFNPSNLLGLPC